MCVCVTGWSVRVTKDGKTYYVNDMEKTTTWERPTTSSPASRADSVSSDKSSSSKSTKRRGGSITGGPPPALPARPGGSLGQAARVVEPSDAPPAFGTYMRKQKQAQAKPSHSYDGNTGGLKEPPPPGYDQYVQKRGDVVPAVRKVWRERGAGECWTFGRGMSSFFVVVLFL